MRNRGAYSTKERMPSDIERPSTNQPGRLYLIGCVLPSRQKLGIGAIPPHILVSLVCTGLRIVLSSRQFWTSDFFTTAGSYFVSVFGLSEVAPAGGGSFSWEAPQGLPEKRRTRISMGFATSKAHKRETQGKYFYLVYPQTFISFLIYRI